MARTAKQRAATKRMIAANKARTGGAKRRKGAKRSGAKRAKAAHHGALEKRVARLEHNQKVIVGVLHAHDRALRSGGLLTGRAKRTLPAVGGR